MDELLGPNLVPKIILLYGYDFKLKKRLHAKHSEACSGFAWSHKIVYNIFHIQQYLHH